MQLSTLLPLVIFAVQSLAENDKVKVPKPSKSAVAHVVPAKEEVVDEEEEDDEPDELPPPLLEESSLLQEMLRLAITSATERMKINFFIDQVLCKFKYKCNEPQIYVFLLHSHTPPPKTTTCQTQ